MGSEICRLHSLHYDHADMKFKQEQWTVNDEGQTAEHRKTSVETCLDT